MRVSVSWLGEHLDAAALPATAEEVGDAFVRVGLEVEEIHPAPGVTGPLTVGRVEEIEELTGFKKPIRYCQVALGERTRGVVCGATNFAVGDLVAVAEPGAVLPGGFVIASRETYRHTSDGMIASARELGLGADHSGILVLPSGTAEPGDDAIRVLGLDEPVIELAVTPDRGYCFSLRGLARELATSTDADYTDPVIRIALPDTEGAAWPVTVEATDRAPRYVMRRVNGVDPAAPTPWWMQRRLITAGMRPISLTVDVTNYVMLDLGQPLHAFDAGRTSGAIVVRRAMAGETLRTLDGVDRKLDPDDLLITDDSGPIGMAGVMGGESTEIPLAADLGRAGDGTQPRVDVLLEAAHFDPAGAARTARRHKLPSEASKRFERVVDPALPPYAAERAAKLLVDLGGGTLADGRTDEGGIPAVPAVRMPLSLPDRTAGVAYRRGATVHRLNQVGCHVELDTSDDGRGMVVASPPTWRPDLRQPADLVEEVLRLEGYDTIPSTLPAAPPGRGLTGSQLRRRAVSRALAEAGHVEVLPFPFVSDGVWDKLGLPADDDRRRTVVVSNPLDADRARLATTLLPGLLDMLVRNRSRGFDDLALYTVGQVALPSERPSAMPDPPVTERPSDDDYARIRAALPDQPTHVAVVLSGDREPRGWWGTGRAAVWSDAVQAARLVGDAAGVALRPTRAEHAPWHPGRCAALWVGDWGTEAGGAGGVGRTSLVGHAGELHPNVVEAFGLPPRTVAMELDLDAIPLVETLPVPAVSGYPPIAVDVALVAADDVPAADLADALTDGGGSLLEAVRLFDVYSGAQVGDGRRSLAFSLRMRAPDRTLTNEEANAARDAAVAEASRRHGAVLR